MPYIQIGIGEHKAFFVFGAVICEVAFILQYRYDHVLMLGIVLIGHFIETGKIGTAQSLQCLVHLFIEFKESERLILIDPV